MLITLGDIQTSGIVVYPFLMKKYCVLIQSSRGKSGLHTEGKREKQWLIFEFIISILVLYLVNGIVMDGLCFPSEQIILVPKVTDTQKEDSV